MRWGKSLEDKGQGLPFFLGLISKKWGPSFWLIWTRQLSKKNPIIFPVSSTMGGRLISRIIIFRDQLLRLAGERRSLDICIRVKNGARSCSSSYCSLIPLSRQLLEGYCTPSASKSPCRLGLDSARLVCFVSVCSINETFSLSRLIIHYARTSEREPTPVQPVQP